MAPGCLRRNLTGSAQGRSGPGIALYETASCGSSKRFGVAGRPASLRPQVRLHRHNRTLILEAHPVCIESLVGFQVGKGYPIHCEKLDAVALNSRPEPIPEILEFPFDRFDGVVPVQTAPAATGHCQEQVAPVRDAIGKLALGIEPQVDPLNPLAVPLQELPPRPGFASPTNIECRWECGSDVAFGEPLGHKAPFPVRQPGGGRLLHQEFTWNLPAVMDNEVQSDGVSPHRYFRQPKCSWVPSCGMMASLSGGSIRDAGAKHLHQRLLGEARVEDVTIVTRYHEVVLFIRIESVGCVVPRQQSQLLIQDSPLPPPQFHQLDRIELPSHVLPAWPLQ